MSSVEEGFLWDWENESTPLEPLGSGPPKFLLPGDKHNVNEGETAFIAFNVEGNPAPQVTWNKGFKDLKVEPRYKMWTKGGLDGENLVILGINQCRPEEEGDYKCILKNECGEDTFEFKFFVTVEGGMDFRAMLLKRKKPAKKVAVLEYEWIETPVDVTVQEGKGQEVTFTARLSEKDKKGKWFLRNEETLKSNLALEHGVEINNDDPHFEFSQEGDCYTLICKDPKKKHSGRYTLCVKLEKDSKFTSAYLDVEDSDPEFYFLEKLEENCQGYTNRPVSLHCRVNAKGANVKWFKGGQAINLQNGNYEKKDGECDFELTIGKCTLEDSSLYTCQIMDFVKVGEDSDSSTILQIIEYPHTFTSNLSSQNAVENDRCEFEIDVEAEDAEVTWYQNGQPITSGRFEIIKVGKKRKLVLKCASLADTGEISVRTNTQESSCQLNVQCENDIILGLPPKHDPVEREELSLEVQVRDPEAPIYLYLNDELMNGDHRLAVENKGHGHHEIVLKAIQLTDMKIEFKTPKRGTELSSVCKLNVIKGEEVPQLGDCPPVTGIAMGECKFGLPYSLEGQPQSLLEVFVIKDGKELILGRDIDLKMDEDQIKLAVINPTRDKSGVYTVVLRNAQGEVRRDINVNILDKPTPPRNLKVNDIRKDRCHLHWEPPLDDGGSGITRYVVEAIDLSMPESNWNIAGETFDPQKCDFPCTNLDEGHRYKFRVFAVNQLGKSQPCTLAGDGILMRDPWDPPDPPSRPVTEDWGPTFCHLSWYPPDFDGGAPITHYQIEYLEKELSCWQKDERIRVEDLRVTAQGQIFATCPGLTEGFAYLFRVKACNKAGPSKPSPASEPFITAINRSVKPYFHQPGMYDIEVKKGRPIGYDVVFSGEPAPLFSWFRQDQLLLDDDWIRMSESRRNKAYNEITATLRIEDSDRSRDTGTYKIILESKSGICQASGFVNVLDVPGPPRAFEVKQIYPDKVTFAWKPPSDDGGRPIKQYQIRMMDFETGDWHIVGDFKDLQGTVTGLRPGRCYEFEIVAIGPEGESLATKISDPVFTTENTGRPSPPLNVVVVAVGNTWMSLNWERPLTDGNSPITSYMIEKQEEGKSWLNVCSVSDSNNLQHTVPNLLRGRTYQFRISALNAKGISEPSASSNPQLCEAPYRAPMIDQGQGGTKIVRENRKVEWRIVIRGNPPPQASWSKGEGDTFWLHGNDVRVYEVEAAANAETEAVLSIGKCKKADAGHYKLTVKNELGCDSLSIDLIVLDDLDNCECSMFKRADLNCPCKHRNDEFNAKKLLQQEVMMTMMENNQWI